jgi:Tfp pilus assembly protein PilV
MDTFFAVEFVLIALVVLGIAALGISSVVRFLRERRGRR